MNEPSLQWAEFSLKYGAIVPKAAIGVVVSVLGILLVWRGWVLVEAADSLWRVRSSGVVLATGHLERGMSWSHGQALPVEVVVEPVEVLASGSAVQWLSGFTNPNPDWIARVQYRMVSETVTTAIGRTVAVLPSTTLPILEGGMPLSAGRETVQVAVEGIRWQRWTSVPEYLRWIESPFRLLSATSDAGITMPTVTIRIQNQGALGYKDVLLLLRWEEGRRVSGAVVVPIQSIASQEVREIKLRVDRSVASYARFFLDPIFDPTDVLHVGLQSFRHLVITSLSHVITSRHLVTNS